MDRMKSDTASFADATAQFGLAGDEWIRAAPAMAHSLGEDGRLRSVSDVWLKKLGYARDEVIGRKVISFLTPASGEHATNYSIPELFDTGRCENAEYQFVSKAGDVIDILVSSVVDRNAPGGPAALSVITDITAQKSAERQLIESEARYRSMVDDQTDLVGVVNPEFQLTFVNKAYAKHQGLEPSDMIGRSMFDFVPEHTRPQLLDLMRQTMATAHAVDAENEVTLADGRLRWVAWSNRAIRGGDDEVTAIHFVGRDIDERKRAEQQLAESEALYRLLADHSTDMVFQFDLDLVRTYISPACREILGLEPYELIGKQGLHGLHPDDAEAIHDAFHKIAAGRLERGSFSYRVRRSDGRWLWVETAARATKDPATGAPTGLIGALRDITAKKEVEEKLAEANRRLEILAGQDALTQIYNRRTFDEMLTRELKIARREGTTLSLLMIDVDAFKAYNDCYGHPAGDAALRQISAVIRTSIKRPSDMAARYGGEEFAVLLPNTDADGAAAVAAMICAGIQDLQLEHVQSAAKILTVSIGVASANNALRDSLRHETLLRRADKALYAAKSNGRNTIELWHEALVGQD